MLWASWLPVIVGAWPTSVSTCAFSALTPCWYSSSVRPKSDRRRISAAMAVIATRQSWSLSVAETQVASAAS